MVTQRLNLNTIPSGVWPRIAVSQGDSGSRVFEFTIYNGTELYDIPAASVAVLNGTKPDGNPVSYMCECEENIVTADCADALTQVPGNVYCELQIVSPGLSVLGTANFIIYVEANPYNRADLSDIDLSSLYQFVDATAQNAANAEAAEQNSSAWAVGQRNGQDVTEDDPTYQNNAKYYATLSGDYAENAAASAETARINYGSPLIATRGRRMTDTNRVYVYAGSEAGYTYGDWYYYDDEAGEWVDGGVYNSTAFVTDTTLDWSGRAADSKVVGDFFRNAIAAKYTYNALLTYAVGDYVTYGNHLYRCIIPVSAQSAWDASKWEEVSTTGEISDIKDGMIHTDANGYFYVITED